MPAGRPLRVALVHSYYGAGQPSGENLQVDVERRALARAGVEVEVFGAHTDDLTGDRLYPLRAALRVATGRGASPLDALRAFAPDVVHVHNLFPNFGRRWVQDVEAPLVATLHNFRFACAAATLFRDGHVCTDCPDGRPASALRHRCYRGSVVATLPLAVATRRGPAADPVVDRADRLLCIFPRQRALLEAAGVASERIVDWSNFLPDGLAPAARPAATGHGCLYSGRLTDEKGVVDLVAAWSGDVPLTVVGDGPCRDAVERAARGRAVRVAGRVPRDRALALLRSSSALALPSLWPEVMPLSAIEALACGVPIVVRAGTEAAPAVTGAGVGVAVESPAGFAPAAAALAGDEQMSARCRATFADRYTEAAWLARTLGLYRSLAEPAVVAGSHGAWFPNLDSRQRARRAATRAGRDGRTDTP